MKLFARFVPVVAGLVMLMNITPSWGQTPVCGAPGCNPTVSDANGNTAGGTGALRNVAPEPPLRGVGNTAFGSGALLSNTTGSANTATGAQALINFTGDNNTATGYGTLFFNTTGNRNTAVGAGALTANTTGDNNTATGRAALAGNTAGVNNTATGLQALFLNSSGDKNTALGNYALWQSRGYKNIAIGFTAGVNLAHGNNNIFIANQGVGDEFQTIRIGTAQTQTFMAGINTAGVSGTVVVVDANRQLGITLSSALHKRDIAP